MATFWACLGKFRLLFVLPSGHTDRNKNILCSIWSGETDFWSHSAFKMKSPSLELQYCALEDRYHSKHPSAKELPLLPTWYEDTIPSTNVLQVKLIPLLHKLTLLLLHSKYRRLLLLICHRASTKRLFLLLNYCMVST